MKALRCIFVFTLTLLSFFPEAPAINGLEGTFEFACDAPWRIEPRKLSDGSVEYGAIPIQITIHDAMYAGLDKSIYVITPSGGVPVHLPDSLVSLGKVHSISIREVGPLSGGIVVYSLAGLHEIEMTTGDWLWPNGPDKIPK